jgi:FkbM family methyltransferase
MISDKPYNEILDTKHGKFCVTSADRMISRCLRELGESQETETELLCSLVGPGGIVLDVGANVGIHSVPLARKVGNSGLVFAFEPQRINYLNLCANAAINSLYSLRPMQAACGAESGEVMLTEFDPWLSANTGGYRIRDHEKTGKVSVPMIALDDFNLPRVDLIKIDVEEMEPEVLRGAAKLIGRTMPYIYTESQSVETLKAQGEELKNFSYVGYMFTAPFWNANNYRGVTENNWVNIGTVNVLFVPDGKPKPDCVGELLITTGIPK